MESADDTIVLVITDDDETDIKEELLTDNFEKADYANILETAEKHGVHLDVEVKVEPEDGTDTEYIEEYLQEEEDLKLVKEEYLSDDETEGYQPENDEYIPDYDEFMEQDDDDDEYMYNPTGNRKSQKLNQASKSKTKAKRAPKSFVEDLRQQYKELSENEAKLIDALEQIMRNVVPPDLPRDVYIINGILFECVFCGNLSQTIPAAGRHYHEKHGPRYLICYACGEDFRSTTNLYKHEKRCQARDAHIVLKARAAAVGSKARGRPYMARARGKPFRLVSRRYKPKDPNEFSCPMCSAVLTTKATLDCHLNMHRGERPYRCEQCPRAYTSMSALTRHMHSHLDLEYICDHCNRSFKTKPVLRTHLNTHLPVRQHACPECDRRFAQKSALALHINRVHRNLPPPCACNICPKRYPRMSLLKAHMKRAHGFTLMTREMLFKVMPAMTEYQLKETLHAFHKLL